MKSPIVMKEPTKMSSGELAMEYLQTLEKFKKSDKGKRLGALGRELQLRQIMIQISMW